MKNMGCFILGFLLTLQFVHAGPTSYPVQADAYSGTATVVNDGAGNKVFVTNIHLANKARVLYTRDNRGSVVAIPVQNYKIITDDEIGFILAPAVAANFSAAAIARGDQSFLTQAAVGTIVYTHGYGTGGVTASIGSIAGYVGGKILVSDTGTTAGMSGSPVYNSNNVVIGIHKGRVYLNGRNYQVVEPIEAR